MCVFFYCGRRQGKEKLRWAPARGQSQKKKHHPGCCFFFAPATGKGRGRRSPVGRRHGARAKKRTPPMVICFFCCGPGEWQGKEKPRWAPARGQSKKKTPPRVCVFFFFLLRPRRKAGEGEASLGAGTGPEQKKKNTQGVFVFFAAAPTKGRGRWTPRPFGGARTHCGLGRFRQGRMVLFFCCGPAGSFLVSLKRLGGAAAKKKHHGRCFFLLRPRADAHSLTAGLGGASPSPFAAAPPGPGWCFFFAVAPPRRSLTHCGLGRFRQGSGGVFFLLWPRRVFFG